MQLFEVFEQFTKKGYTVTGTTITLTQLTVVKKRVIVEVISMQRQPIAEQAAQTDSYDYIL